MKFKVWDGSSLQGLWTVTRKIDGVRCHRIDGQYLSRAKKPLHNIPEKDFEVAEIFCGDFKTTIENTRTFTSKKQISVDQIYTIEPLDSRLILGTEVDPTAATINEYFETAIMKGDEGLILVAENERLKVKPFETYDVEVTEIQAGTGKYEGMMGALITPMGKVGTGFTDKERLYNQWLGKIIEVKCMELTTAGKFRHPRFLRLREDKA